MSPLRSASSARGGVRPSLSTMTTREAFATVGFAGEASASTGLPGRHLRRRVCRSAFRTLGHVLRGFGCELPAAGTTEHHLSDDNLDDLEYLKERAIDPEIAREAKVRLHDAAEYAESIGYPGDVSGTAIVFPYQNVPSYSRARIEGDGPRWISPAGADVSIYVFDTPRAPVAESEFLAVVESPAKALALISAGIAAMVQEKFNSERSIWKTEKLTKNC